MLQKLIEKAVAKAMNKQAGKPDQSEEIARLQKEVSELQNKNTELQGQIENSGPAKRLAKLKEMAASIPAGAQGVGQIPILEDGAMKNVPLKSKQDLEDIIARAERGEIEVFLS